MGIQESTIRNWEGGTPIANLALSELDRRGVSLAYLLRGEGDVLKKSPSDVPGEGQFIQPGTAEVSEKYAALLGLLAELVPPLLCGQGADLEEVGKLLDDAADVVGRIRQLFAEQDTDQRAG